MKLFKATKSGMLIAFGFDMVARRPDQHVVCWSDPETGSWEPSAQNSAGSHSFLSIVIAPEFVFEGRSGIVAYQPGMAIQMAYVGFPTMWAFSILSPE